MEEWNLKKSNRFQAFQSKSLPEVAKLGGFAKAILGPHWGGPRIVAIKGGLRAAKVKAAVVGWWNAEVMVAAAVKYDLFEFNFLQL